MVGIKPWMTGLLSMAALAGCGAPLTMAPMAVPAVPPAASAFGADLAAEGFFDPDPTWAQTEIGREMKALGVKFRPQVVIDWTSYVDDNSQVIHLSRLKFSKRFRSLTQNALYDTTFIHLLRHETAHAFFNTQYHQGLTQQFTDTFGSAKTPYNVRLIDQALASMRFKDRPEFASKYAQLHPLEDFAETFAVYLQKGGDQAKLDKYVAQKNKNLGLKRKFAYVALLIKSLRDRYPVTPVSPVAPPAP